MHFCWKPQVIRFRLYRLFQKIYEINFDVFFDHQHESYRCRNSAFSSVTAGSLAFDFYQHNFSFDHEEEITAKDAFPTYQLFNKQISTSESAYFNLKLWLCCEDEINALTKAEFMEIRPIYEQLKRMNNIYYESLVKQGIANSFERLYQKFNVD